MTLVLTELQIQTAAMEYVQIMRNVDERFKLVFAVPNGGKRGFYAQKQAKKEGLTAGVSDVLVLCPNHDNTYTGACFEFKSKKGKLTKHQEQFLDTAVRHGNFIAVIRDAKDFINMINNYFGINNQV